MSDHTVESRPRWLGAVLMEKLVVIMLWLIGVNTLYVFVIIKKGIIIIIILG